MYKALAGAAALLVSSAVLWAQEVTVSTTLRDFSASHADFEILDWNALTPAAFFQNNQNNKLEKGIVGLLGSGLSADGDPVYSSLRDPGFYNTVSSANSFNQWWTNVGGVNFPFTNFPLTFHKNANGTYTFNAQGFFPIDGQGLGNEGFDHNYHFTLHWRQSFVYAPGQTFYAESDDDTWVFVDGKLALDMGGIHGTWGGAVDLDSLGLTPGQAYPLDLFYAERNRYGAALRIDTSILPEPAAIALLLPLALASLMRRPRL